MWASIISIASMTSVALSCDWYPHAISLTVTGMPSGLSFSFANTTCSANRLTGSNAESNSGSDPNCTTRVTYFALGLLKREAKRVSRRVFQMFGSSHPNQMRAWTPKPLFHAASTMSSLRSVNMGSRVNQSFSLEVFAIACAVQPHVATFKTLPDVPELSVKLFAALACTRSASNMSPTIVGGRLTAGDLVTDSNETVLRTHITPPVRRRLWDDPGHPEVQGGKA